MIRLLIDLRTDVTSNIPQTLPCSEINFTDVTWKHNVWSSIGNKVLISGQNYRVTIRTISEKIALCGLRWFKFN